MEYRSHAIVAAILVLSFLMICDSASAIGSQAFDQKLTMRGLPGVAVEVGTPKDDIEADGLRQSEIRTDVELRLRLAKIAIFDQAEMASKELPYLFVQVDTYRNGDYYTYSMRTELHQMVALRNGAKADAITWSRGYFGRVSAQNVRRVREIVRDRVDEFVNDWLSVNSK